jgi:hypothetical protein
MGQTQERFYKKGAVFARADAPTRFLTEPQRDAAGGAAADIAPCRGNRQSGGAHRTRTVRMRSTQLSTHSSFLDISGWKISSFLLQEERRTESSSKKESADGLFCGWFVWFCTGGRAVLGHVIEVGAVGDVTEVGAQLLGLYEIEDAWASAAAGAGGSSCSRL